MENLDYKYLGDLVVKAQHGDSNAFAELYAATYQKQYRYSYRYLKDEYLAQDALQETFIQVLRNINRLRDPELFIAWLGRINFRVCYDMKKKLGSGGMVEEGIAEIEGIHSQEGRPEEEAVEVDSRKYIMEQIMSLPVTESQAIIMRYYQNMQLDEIADQLNVSRSSVKRYLKAGKEHLERLLADFR